MPSRCALHRNSTISSTSMKPIWRPSLMVDRERVLARLDDLERHLRELREVTPASLEEYLQKVEKRRACERLLQIAIENVIDICGLFVTGLRLGLPGEEDDLFEMLERKGTLSASLTGRLPKEGGVRNLLVHEYGPVDDRLVYEAARSRFPDFEEFRQAILGALRQDSA